MVPLFEGVVLGVLLLVGVERSQCGLQHPALPSSSVFAVHHTGCAKHSDGWAQHAGGAHSQIPQ